MTLLVRLKLDNSWPGFLFTQKHVKQQAFLAQKDKGGRNASQALEIEGHGRP